VGEPGRLAGDDPDAGATVAPARHLFDAAVVEASRCGPLVLGIDLGEVPAGAHRGTEDTFEDVVIDHPRHVTGDDLTPSGGLARGVHRPFASASPSVVHR
jgi:hypothetical protein